MNHLQGDTKQVEIVFIRDFVELAFHKHSERNKVLSSIMKSAHPRKGKQWRT